MIFDKQIKFYFFRNNLANIFFKGKEQHFLSPPPLKLLDPELIVCTTADNKKINSIPITAMSAIVMSCFFNSALESSCF